MAAYYNEIDPYAAQWLRNLIKAGHIADGQVDERSIEDVTPNDLRGFTQCHFFAGIGVWSRSLRQAGWDDRQMVWTGSCPCQPFSTGGKKKGFADKRHLWPAFYHLIRECRPAVVFGEQVASKDVDPWIDLVQDDLEAVDYAVGAVPFPAASIGSPHIRDRLYWVANNNNSGLQRRSIRWDGTDKCAVGSSGLVGRVGDAEFIGTGRNPGTGIETQRRPPVRSERNDIGSSGSISGMANNNDTRRCGEQGLRLQRPHLHDADGRRPVNGLWADADWIPCRDGKWRPVESGTFPLAHGAASRVGRLRAYGNAIVAAQAEEFIKAFMER